MSWLCWYSQKYHRWHWLSEQGDIHSVFAEQRNFAAQVGPLHVHPIYPQHAEAHEIMVLDTEVTDLKDNALWHTDVPFTTAPPMGAVLSAQVLPAQGGDTLWSSKIAA